MVRRSGNHRDRGAVLVVSMIVVMSLFALSGVALALSVREGSSFNERMDSTAALYLAEGAIARARWEFGQYQDPGGDGEGTVNWSSGNKSYDVIFTPLSASEVLLSAVATVGEQSVGLEVVLGAGSATTRWPKGALSVIGDVDKLKFQFRNESNLILAGGDTPAMRISDQDTYDAFLAEFAAALDSGDMPAANLTGSPEVDVNGTKVPIEHVEDYEAELKQLTDLYDNLVAEINNLRPIADFEITDLDRVKSTFGSPGNPVTVYVSGDKDLSNETITGYGNLILGNKFKVNDSTLNWTGDIYVVGDDSKNAEFEVSQGSTFDLDGNLTILGEGYDSSKFKVKEGAIANIDGSVFIGTDWEQRKKQKAEFKVEKNAAAHINGIVTLIGPRVKLECKEKDDDGNPETNVLDINGIMQIGLPPIPPPPVPDCEKDCDTKFELKVSGLIDIYRDDAAIELGASGLEKIGTTLGVPQMNQLIRREATVRTWKKVVPNPNGAIFTCPVHGQVHSSQGHTGHSL